MKLDQLVVPRLEIFLLEGTMGKNVGNPWLPLKQWNCGLQYWYHIQKKPLQMLPNRFSADASQIWQLLRVLLPKVACLETLFLPTKCSWQFPANQDLMMECTMYLSQGLCQFRADTALSLVFLCSECNFWVFSLLWDRHCWINDHHNWRKKKQHCFSSLSSAKCVCVFFFFVKSPHFYTLGRFVWCIIAAGICCWFFSSHVLQ